MPRKKLTQADEKQLEDIFVDVVSPEAKKVVGRPFQPGQSGNPTGHPQEAEGLDANLRLVIGKTGARKLARTLFDMATGADGSSGHVKLSALSYLFDRLEGRPVPQTKDGTPEEEPIILILRKIAGDNSALAGRPLPPQLGPVVEGEVREYPGEGAGA